jgi:hypothetical protein
MELKIPSIIAVKRLSFYLNTRGHCQIGQRIIIMIVTTYKGEFRGR